MDNLNLWISDYREEYAAGDFSEDVLIRGFRMSSGTWDSSTPGKPYCVLELKYIFSLFVMNLCYPKIGVLVIFAPPTILVHPLCLF